MPPGSPEQLGHLLLSYSGAEADKVRTAIAKLAQDDLELMKHFLDLAHNDHRRLIQMADRHDDETRKRRALRAMSVNERLSELNLFAAFDEAIVRQDRVAVAEILMKCELSYSNIEKIIDAKFKPA